MSEEKNLHAEPEVVLALEELYKEFPIKTGFLKTKPLAACNGISFSIKKGQGLALVGESGCGKSTTARCILQLEKLTKGRIILHGEDMSTFSKAQMKAARSRIQMVFQDPSDCLNPRFNVRQMLTEVLQFHTDIPASQREARCLELLKQVGMDGDCMDKYPHEFSGGQQQRLGIARALATGADIFVLDEPTAALDTSIQGQILELLIKLKEEHQFTYLFITHNLGVIQYLCENTAVMYLGKIVEMGPTEALLSHPIHPYTKALLSSIPIPDPDIPMDQAEKLEGETPSPIDVPKGCFLAGRCAYVQEACKGCTMELQEYGPGHYSSCIFSRQWAPAQN